MRQDSERRTDMNNEFSYKVESGDFAAAGQVSSTIKTILKKLGVDKGVLRRISIASYEAEINMVIHSIGGVMKLEINSDSIKIYCDDTGPGIEDISLAMKEGYSTAGEKARMMGFGAGMGLSNMKRNSDDFQITSALGEGTHIVMTFKM